MAEQMDLAGLSWRRLQAVDGSNLSAAELKHLVEPAAVHMLPRGVIGCFLSHRRFWEKVQEEGHSCAVVLEDDVEVMPGFSSAVRDYLSELPPAWDVCLLGALGCAHPDGILAEGFLNPLMAVYLGGTRRCRKVSDRLFVPRKPGGTHAYAVSQRGASKLLRLLPKASFHVDLVAWHSALPLALYAVHPFIAFQDTTKPSTLVDGSSVGGVRSLHWLDMTQLMVGGGTRQSWAHVFAEPLLRVPGGLLITVGRHQLALGLGLAIGSALHVSSNGLVRLTGKLLLGLVGSFAIAIWAGVRWLVHLSLAAAAEAQRAMEHEHTRCSGTV
eukprot:CAMPEP_0119318024 /NCGR_PEP_ID=MMETSP1333-20130426/45337_1 /TAXON_ID=418940 /ORGANISM="Scyphosphaera apsteinii, Strain RCC1455" /LENGTH=326 /DNA_ID=CAMNT_0007324119 /DNA_START=180 /DNA_END=1160 /DNA_ORIENTATION=+